MSRPFQVRVWPLQKWLDWRQLLGPGEWATAELAGGYLKAEASLERAAAADLAARLRGVGIGGSLIR
ncbi:MAG: hypothetical protein IZT59_03310, partial [Verrucomicrobia bacterium]|nr:hypothetical protein [Verrucomicrobiota bacterium]